MALSDLDEIWEYISVKLENPAAAENTVNGILDSVDKLKEHSGVGAPLFFGNNLFSGYRYVIYNEYLAFYRVSGSTVNVDRVLYGRRDYIRILFGDI